MTNDNTPDRRRAAIWRLITWAKGKPWETRMRAWVSCKLLRANQLDAAAGSIKLLTGRG